MIFKCPLILLTYHFLFFSILPEHRIHVSALTLLSIELDASVETGESGRKSKSLPPDEAEKKALFTEEELTLLIQGNPGFGGSITIGLEDFECTSLVPDWIPAVYWEDVLAISVLPGPLEGICVHIADAAEQWKTWFNTDKPEVIKLLIKTFM